ncbi:hypothetical protein ACVWY2_008257 [Bradyrhizobium sp. JR6.1]
MIAGLPLSFAEPLLLLGLVSLPVLWWMLRVMPPRPRRIEFPPTRLLFDIAPKEETPSRTPWWLTLLRLAAAALVIFAAAGPIWNPQTGVAAGKQPLVILLDDGWSAASSWDARIKAADELVTNADSDRRGVALVPLSEPTRDITLMPAGAARVALRQLAPKPHSIDRVETLATLERFLKSTGDCDIAWLSDGVDTGRGSEFTEGLGKVIESRNLTIYAGGAQSAQALVAAENAAAKMTVKVLRTESGIAAGTVRAVDAKGSPIGEARYAFGPQERETEAAFDLPVELRNDIARLEISGEHSAGAVQLLDRRWRRRAIGVVSGASNDTAQPLLASTFYLSRALSPFADVRLGDRGAPQQVIGQFLDQRLPMIVMADVGTLSPEIRDRLNAWIEQGGVLVRFAGPRLAQADDDLVPVKLRRGGRTLGGSLTWEKPQHMASFAADGPFTGLTVPKDITVSRQVLAEPDAVLATKSWASLEDGTPLVTGERRGKGVVSLFHVGADMRWSDLPMSGTFVEMLRRLIDMSGYTSKPGPGVASDPNAETVAPLRTLDGFGAFGPPPSTAKPMSADYRDRGTADHPPGFYGTAESPIAVNTLASADRIAPLDTSGLRAKHATYTNTEPRDLRGIMLSTALALFLLDAIVVAMLGGGLAALIRRRAAPAVLALAFVLATMMVPSPTRAQNASSDDFAIKAVSQTRLAYVVTGNADVDSIVKSGMSGLTLFLGQRTALEAGDPVGHRSRARRAGVLPPDLLADRAGRAEAGAGRHQQDRRLYEAGRHGDLRHPRRRRGAAGRQWRVADAGYADAARIAVDPRRARARAGAARACADQDILSAARLPRPLQHGPDLGRGAAARRRRGGRAAPGTRRRRRLADHHHVERPRRRLGDPSRRAADAAADPGRAAPARIRVPRRRQHRDVHADRQLQGRPGTRACLDRAAGAMT